MMRKEHKTEEDEERDATGEVTYNKGVMAVSTGDSTHPWHVGQGGVGR